MRIAACLLMLTFAPGCAASWLVGRATGVYFDSGSGEHVTPFGGTERQLAVAPRYTPPPAPPKPASTQPAPAAEPAPPVNIPVPPRPHRGAVVIIFPSPIRLRPAPPKPAPHDPIVDRGPGSVQLACTLSERPAHEHVRAWEFLYGPMWRVWTGFMFVSEAAISAGLLATYRGRGNTGGKVVGIALGADALGSLILAFHPAETRVTDFDRPGTWESTSGCPASLSVDTPAGPRPVASNGGLDAASATYAALALTSPSGALVLRDRGATAVIDPSARDRCGWARAHAVPSADALCAGLGDAPSVSLQVTFPVEHVPAAKPPAR